MNNTLYGESRTMLRGVSVLVLWSLSGVVGLAGSGLGGGAWACPSSVEAEARLGGCSSVAEWEAVRVFGFGHILQMAYSPDGKRLGMATRLGVVVWNNEEAVIERVLMGPVASTSSVAWSPDGRRIAGAEWWPTNHAVRIWEVQTGQLVATLSGHTDALTSVAWSPDGEHLLSGSEDGTLRIWGCPPAARLPDGQGRAGPPQVPSGPPSPRLGDRAPLFR